MLTDVVNCPRENMMLENVCLVFNGSVQKLVISKALISALATNIAAFIHFSNKCFLQKMFSSTYSYK